MARELTRRRQTGLTLIELLVVLAIAAAVAGVIAFNAPPPTDGARREVDRFAARLAAASHRAILKGEMVGLDLTPAGYDFFFYRRGAWAAIDDSALRSRRFSDGMSVTFDVAGTLAERPGETERNRRRDDHARGGDAGRDDASLPTPEVFFSPTGEATPVRAQFSKNRRSWLVTLAADGEVTVTRHDAR
ncbi:MAG: type II secretion system minor pseudopilin GspH [Pseudomonadota bacterium]